MTPCLRMQKLANLIMLKYYCSVAITKLKEFLIASVLS